MEAIRLNGIFGSYRESQTSMTVNDQGRDVQIKPGDKVFVGFVSTPNNHSNHPTSNTMIQVKANRDPTVFPSPDEVRLDRPMDSYIQYGLGPHTCLGKEASKVALTAMLRVVGRLENLRRAPGPQGQLKKVPREGGFYVYMKEDYTSYFPFPMSELPFPPSP